VNGRDGRKSYGERYNFTFNIQMKSWLNFCLFLENNLSNTFFSNDIFVKHFYSISKWKKCLFLSIVWFEEKLLCDPFAVKRGKEREQETNSIFKEQKFYKLNLSNSIRGNHPDRTEFVAISNMLQRKLFIPSIK